MNVVSVCSAPHLLLSVSSNLLAGSEITKQAEAAARVTISLSNCITAYQKLQDHTELLFLENTEKLSGIFFSFFKKCWQMEKSTSLFFFFFFPSQDLFNFSFLTSFIYLSANIKSSPLPKLCFYTDIQRLQSSQPFTWSLFKQIELLEPFTARHIF